MKTQKPVINKFDGSYRFLSNFFPATVKLRDIEYPTVEHAFQAAKSQDHVYRERVRKTTSPAGAKALGRKVVLRSDWEDVKDKAMLGLLRQKFRHPELRKLLLSTGNAKLIEGNTWRDFYWGVCNGKGRNVLGRLLMQVRNEIRSNESEI